MIQYFYRLYSTESYFTVLAMFLYVRCMYAQSCPICETPWTVACQTPLSMGFPRQEYWSGLQFSSPGDLPDPGLKPISPATPIFAGRFFSTSTTWEVPVAVQFSSVQFSQSCPTLCDPITAAH